MEVSEHRKAMQSQPISTLEQQMLDALLAAIEIAGNQKIFADRMGVSQQSVSLWVKNGKVPAERVVDAEVAVDGKIIRQKFRPDLFQELATST